MFAGPAARGLRHFPERLAVTKGRRAGLWPPRGAGAVARRPGDSFLHFTTHTPRAAFPGRCAVGATTYADTQPPATPWFHSGPPFHNNPPCYEMTSRSPGQ